MFKPGNILDLVPGKDYFLTVRLYNSPLKFSRMRTASTAPKGISFIIPKDMLEADEGLYQIEIYDPEDKDSFETIKVINVGNQNRDVYERCNVDPGEQVEETTNP